MATTDLASTESQRRLASAVTAVDQAVRGRGTVGFALAELPWTEDSFDGDRAFLISACERASSETDWHRLAYEPSRDLLVDMLARIADLLSTLEASDIVDPPENLWSLMPDEVDARCERHQVYLHRYGCVVCNETGLV